MFFRLHGYTAIFCAKIHCAGRDLSCNHGGYIGLQNGLKSVDSYRIATLTRTALDTVPAPLNRTALVLSAPFSLLSTVPQL